MDNQLSKRQSLDQYSTSRCSERVYRSGSICSDRCQNRAIVEYTRTFPVIERVVVENPQGWDGVPDRQEVTKTEPVYFCATHDPERIAQREAKRRKGWEEEQARSRKLQDVMDDLVGRLGYGLVEWDRGPTGYVKLSGDSVRKLLQELGR